MGKIFSVGQVITDKEHVFSTACETSYIWNFPFLSKAAARFTETVLNCKQCLSEMAADSFKVGKQTKRSRSTRVQDPLTSETQASALQHEAN